MLNLSRRDFVVSSGLAAALGLDARLAVSPAFAQKTADPAKGFVTYKVGAAEVTALYDGIWEKPHDPAFIRNASIDDTRAAMAAGGFTPDFVSIPFTVLLVNTGGKLVLCDAGTGGQVQPTAGKLAANMRAAGIDPERIDTVLISHFHPDHINGIKTKDDELVFPNAEIKVPAVEHAFWSNEANAAKANVFNKAQFPNVTKMLAGLKVSQYEPGKEVAPGITSIATPGHTPGHQSFTVASGGKSILVQTDVTNIPSMFLRNPDWYSLFDNEPQVAQATRHKVYDMAAAEKMVVVGYHFPYPCVGHIEKDGTSYRLVPVAWDPNG